MKEPREYRNNVHYWLRKIFYFVHFADVAEVRVLDEAEENKLMEQQGEDPNKGDPERVLREKLKEPNPDVITKEEAEEACRKLYEMFNMPLDDDVLGFMDDRRCAGGWPRSM